MKTPFYRLTQIGFIILSAVCSCARIDAEAWPDNPQTSTNVASGYATVLWRTVALRGAVGPSGSNPPSFALSGPEPAATVSVPGQFDPYPSTNVHSYTFSKRKPGVYALSGLQDPSDFASFGTAVLQWAIIDGGPTASISVDSSHSTDVPDVSWSSSNADTVIVKGDNLSSSLTSGSQYVRNLRAGRHKFTITAKKGNLLATAEAEVVTIESAPFVHQIPLPISANLKVENDNINEGASDVLKISVTGMADNGVEITGSDGTLIDSPPDLLSVQPKATVTYKLSVLGLVRIDFTSLAVDELWIDFPSGGASNASLSTHLDVPAGTKYTLRMRNGKDWSQMDLVTRPNIATAQATITVLPANIFSVTVVPQTANYTISSGVAAGRTYRRSWGDGGRWHAYLARDGVWISVTAKNSTEGIAQIELQAKTPTSDWSDIAPIQAAKDSSLSAAQAGGTTPFSVRLGSSRTDKPLVPSDSALAGTWQLRARAQSISGKWSDWSANAPLTVEMPIASLTKSARTLPPTQDAGWFSTSPTKTYAVQVWIP